MVASTSLSALQYEQHQHDEIAHRDILALPLDRRLTHMVLHFAKYSGRLFRSDAQGSTLERILIDSTVICLASANALGLTLPNRVADNARTGVRRDSTDVALHPSQVPTWLGVELAIATSEMAKACESLDHMEDYPFRRTMEAGVLRIADLVLVAAQVLQIDLTHAVRTRWSGIERKFSRVSATLAARKLA